MKKEQLRDIVIQELHEQEIIPDYTLDRIGFEFLKKTEYKFYLFKDTTEYYFMEKTKKGFRLLLTTPIKNSYKNE